jgi:DNA-binding NarL/FixJ family response regulator
VSIVDADGRVTYMSPSADRLLGQGAEALAGRPWEELVHPDDVEDLRTLLRLSLEEEPDLRVVGEAEDGLGGVRGVAETRPDVVLLDLSMPKVDGLEALPRILEAAPWAGVVVLSGRDEAAAAPAALALGAERFMAKPAGAAAIRDAVLEVGLRAKPA